MIGVLWLVCYMYASVSALSIHIHEYFKNIIFRERVFEKLLKNPSKIVPLKCLLKEYELKSWKGVCWKHYLKISVQVSLLKKLA